MKELIESLLKDIKHNECINEWEYVNSLVGSVKSLCSIYKIDKGRELQAINICLVHTLLNTVPEKGILLIKTLCLIDDSYGYLVPSVINFKGYDEEDDKAFLNHFKYKCSSLDMIVLISSYIHNHKPNIEELHSLLQDKLINNS